MSDLDSAREAWDAEAAAFDDEPDHGLRDPAVRRGGQRELVPHRAGRTGSTTSLRRRNHGVHGGL